MDVPFSDYRAVLHFWFHETAPQQWCAQSDAFDRIIRQRFFAVWQRAAQGELADWRDTLRGRLAEIIVLDQFSRNLFRDSPAAFAQDLAAVCLAQEALRLPGFAAMKEEERHFILMPLMHSESRAIHTQAAALFERYTSESASDFELRHKAVIDRFGRYPHRNAVLGRESTAEEQDFLSRPGSSF